MRSVVSAKLLSQAWDSICDLQSILKAHHTLWNPPLSFPVTQVFCQFPQLEGSSTFTVKTLSWACFSNSRAHVLNLQFFISLTLQKLNQGNVKYPNNCQQCFQNYDCCIVNWFSVTVVRKICPESVPEEIGNLSQLDSLLLHRRRHVLKKCLSTKAPGKGDPKGPWLHFKEQIILMFVVLHLSKV